MAAIVELQMPIDGEYQPALSIPVEACQRFSVHPLKWLRFVGFTIYGIKGHVSRSTTGPVVEYSDFNTDIEAGVYYYVPDEQEPLLLDPNMMDNRTSESSTISTRRGDFAQDVINRDGNCLMTGAATNFQACHIIPHAKGNQYIKSLAAHRDEDLDPPLDDINDPRNGILLYVGLHRPFGESMVAFLQTPNFAMSVNDVAVVMQPTGNGEYLGFNPSLATSCLTLQHFKDPDVATAFVTPHNSDARQRVGHDDWPPLLLFNISYGCAALHTWGVPHFVDLAQQHTRHIYYEEDDDDAPRVLWATAQEKRRQEMQAVDSSQTRADFTDLILGLWMHNAGKCQRRAHEVKAEKTQEKVRTWLNSTQN